MQHVSTPQHAYNGSTVHSKHTANTTLHPQKRPHLQFVWHRQAQPLAGCHLLQAEAASRVRVQHAVQQSCQLGAQGVSLCSVCASEQAGRQSVSESVRVRVQHAIEQSCQLSAEGVSLCMCAVGAGRQRVCECVNG
jgi:hypothetical protein